MKNNFVLLFSEDKNRALNYVCALIFILAMVFFAVYFKDREIILPEIAAMAVALWVYKSPSWLSQPDKVFTIPTVTALLGFAINMMNIPYLTKISLALMVIIAVMYAVQFIFPPALATGFLPIVTNAHEWSFMISIVATTLVLMLGVLAFRLNQGISREVVFNHKKLWTYAIITAIWIIITSILGIEHFAVIPPITVVLYESLAMKMYSVKMAVKQTMVLTISITLAVLLQLIIKDWLILSAILMVLIYVLLSLFKMKIPAAYAFPFLIFVFPENVVPYLPLASILVGSFSFSMVLVVNKFSAKM